MTQEEDRYQLSDGMRFRFWVSPRHRRGGQKYKKVLCRSGITWFEARQIASTRLGHAPGELEWEIVEKKRGG